MSGLTKFNKILELAISTDECSLPEVVYFGDTAMDKDFILYEETFIPLILLYSDFLYREVYDKKLFNVAIKKAPNGESIFDLKLDNLEYPNGVDEESNAIRLLFLMESFNQVFPKNFDYENNKMFFHDLAINIKNSIADLKEGELIDSKIHMNNVLSNVLYANLITKERALKINKDV